MTTKEEIEAKLIPENYTGRSASQVTAFLERCIKPVLEKNRTFSEEKAELSV